MDDAAYRNAVTEIVERFGTPTYVYDLRVVEQRADEVLRALSKCARFEALYAIKANCTPAVVKVLLKKGFGIDAVSPGEVMLALRLGCAAERIMFTENNATEEELRWALEQGVTVNCGSLHSLRTVKRLAHQRGEQVKVAVRFNPDVGDAECAKTLTAGPLAKFGVHFSLVSQVAALEDDVLRVTCAHMHIGSNILDVEVYAEAMGVIVDTATQLPHLDAVDFGGGLGVPYYGQNERFDTTLLSERVLQIAGVLKDKTGKDIKCKLEPGRFLVAESGALLTRVTCVKQHPQGRLYAGTDSGFNHLIRPCMYGSQHPIETCNPDDDEIVNVDVVGNICESGDVFARARPLPRPREGHVLRIGCAGAYGIVMASHYNMRPLPAEVALTAATELQLLRPRQSVGAFVDSFLSSYDN